MLCQFRHIFWDDDINMLISIIYQFVSDWESVPSKTVSLNQGKSIQKWFEPNKAGIISFSQRNSISKTFTISIARVRISVMLSKVIFILRLTHPSDYDYRKTIGDIEKRFFAFNCKLKKLNGEIFFFFIGLLVHR